MRKLIDAVNMTLDVYCDHTAGIADEEPHQHYTELIRSADTLIYGRITYQLMESHWPSLVKNPSGDKSMDDFAIAIDNVSKIVFSRTLKNVEWRLIFFIYFISAVLFASCKSTLKEAPIMLFNGTGTSPNDVKAIKNILSSNHLDFTLVNSDQLNELDTSQLRKYKLLIIPGGNFIDIGKNLTEETVSNIQKAVHHGLNYLGICAGGFLAGNARYNSLNIATGVQFKFYSAEDRGIRKAAVAITNADGTIIEHYWEDGPQFAGWGEVVSKYPDGTPATVQGRYGSGWVVLTGVHPEAPEDWRQEFYFTTSMESSHNYAVKLVKAALEKTAMSHF